MLEKIREGSQGIVVKIILGFIILTFALAGISGYIGGAADTSAAEVNGEAITRMAYQQAYQAQRARMEQQFGEMFQQLAGDENYMKNFREGVLNSLINEELLKQQAQTLGIRVSNAEIKKQLYKMPEFQVDGKFNAERYQMALQYAGYSTTSFAEYMRDQLARNQLVQSLRTTEFSLPTEAAYQYAIDRQKRDVEYVTIDQEAFKADVKPEQADLDTYYQANIARFEQQEQVSLHYVELKLTDLVAAETVSDDDIDTYYQSNLAEYTENERRRVSHILIESSDDAAAAKSQIDEIKAKLDAGEDFAQLAKSSSQDTFSGEQGGDLEWITQNGDMAPEFEAAAFALANIGEVSDVVETEFGFHIIKLTDRQEESVKPLEAVKDALVEQIKRERAEEVFANMQAELAEKAFEIEDSLEDAAAAIGQSVQTSPLFTSFTAPAPLNAPAVTSIAFSEEIVTEGRNSEVLTVAPDHIVVVRAAEYKPSRTKSLDEVKTEVETAVVNQMASDKAAEKAESLITALKGGESFANLAEKEGLSLEKQAGLERNSGDLDYLVVKEVFEMPKPADSAPEFAQIKMTTGSVAVVALTAVSDAVIDKEDTVTEQRIESQWSNKSFQLYVDGLTEQASVARKMSTDEEQSPAF